MGSFLDPKPLTVAALDTAAAAKINDGASATRGALNATFGTRIGSALNDVVGRIETEAQNVSMLFITDSTGTYDQNTWTSQLPAGLAAKYPTHTISVRTWNYTTGLSWNAATTFATGTGPRTITLWMGGAPGQNWPYFLDVVRRAAFFGGPGQAPDAVFLSMGHNDPTVDTADLTRPHIDRAKLHIERYRLMLPHAVFVLVSQNPTTATKKWSEANADSYRRIAAQRGYGFIDANREFLDYAGPITDLVPAADLHPTPAGYTLWANRVLNEFVSQPGARNAAQALPALSVAGRSVLTRVTAPLASNGWTLSNVTETTEATIVDRRTQTVKLTKTAAGSGSQAWIPLPNFLRGQSVYVVVHMYIPAASYVNTGQVQIREASATKTTAIVPNYMRDQWCDVVVSWDIPHGAPASPNGYRLYINVDPQGGADLPTLYLEDVSVFTGDYPLDPVY